MRTGTSPAYDVRSLPSVVGRPLTECSCRHVASTTATPCSVRKRPVRSVSRIVACLESIPDRRSATGAGSGEQIPITASDDFTLRGAVYGNCQATSIMNIEQTYIREKWHSAERICQ